MPYATDISIHCEEKRSENKTYLSDEDCGDFNDFLFVFLFVTVHIVLMLFLWCKDTEKIFKNKIFGELNFSMVPWSLQHPEVLEAFRPSTFH